MPQRFMLLLTGISLGSLLEILLNCNLALLYLENSRLGILKVWSQLGASGWRRKMKVLAAFHLLNRTWWWSPSGEPNLGPQVVRRGL